MEIKNLLIEAIGVFLLTFSLGINFEVQKQSSSNVQSTQVGIAYMLVYICLFSLYNITPHLNPMITLTLFMLKKINLVYFLAYILTQFISGIFAALYLKVFLSGNVNPVETPELSIVQFFILEIITCSLFVMTYLRAQ